MKFVEYVTGNNKVAMSELAKQKGLTLFQMNFDCDLCGSDVFRSGSLRCSKCQGASVMSVSKQVRARELYLSSKYNLITLSSKLNVPLRDVRWFLKDAGLLRAKNTTIKSNAKFREVSKVIMNLSRVGLRKQGHSDIRVSSILQIFRDHTPKNMRVVTRWAEGQIITVNRIVM
jgi:hypothetical protein